MGFIAPSLESGLASLHTLAISRQSEDTTFLGLALQGPVYSLLLEERCFCHMNRPTLACWRMRPGAAEHSGPSTRPS